MRQCVKCKHVGIIRVRLSSQRKEGVSCARLLTSNMTMAVVTSSAMLPEELLLLCPTSTAVSQTQSSEPRILKMSEDTVSHLPDIKEININPVFPNRTALLHLHNMALNRAFFFSYIL